MAESVYDPSEDTFALADAIEEELSQMKPTKNEAMICVEIGSGSGYVTAVLAKSFSVRGCGCLCFATDVNSMASRATRRTAELSEVAEKIEPIVADLVSPLEARLKGKVDFLVFNPPYVPTDEIEFEESKKKRDISAAWSGGPTGTAVLDRLIPKVPVSEMRLLGQKSSF